MTYLIAWVLSFFAFPLSIGSVPLVKYLVMSTIHVSISPSSTCVHLLANTLGVRSICYMNVINCPGFSELANCANTSVDHCNLG